MKSFSRHSINRKHITHVQIVFTLLSVKLTVDKYNDKNTKIKQATLDKEKKPSNFTKLADFLLKFVDTSYQL